MQVDWLDALLFALGFVLALVAVIALQSLGVAVNDDSEEEVLATGAIALSLGPILLRRKLFGAPNLPEPRQGPLWSLLSITGILMIMAGVGCPRRSSARSFRRALTLPSRCARSAARMIRG